MNTNEIIRTLSQRLKLPQSRVRPIFKHTIAGFIEQLENQKRFTIPGFGTFYTTKRNRRKSYNPFHKKMMLLPEKIVAVFKPSKNLREKIK